jgi:hypothetical protein
MKTKNSKLVVSGILALTLVLPLVTATSHAAGVPSSKATFETSDLILIPETTGTSDWVTVLSGIIKTPSQKDLFISGSLEAGIFTQTNVKSKNLKKDTSTASVSIQVRALVDGEVVPPGVVTYAARTQTLSATLEGAIAGCLTIVTNADGSLSVVLDETCVTPEEIDLILSTLQAASFDFVATDVPVGVHTVSIQARITTSGSAEAGSFTALGFVGKGTMIVDEVRLVKGAGTSTQ